MATPLNRASARKSSIPAVIGWVVMTALAVLIAFVSSHYFALDPNSYFDQQRLVYITNTGVLITHIGGSIAALIIGPFQFVDRLRRGKLAKLHRWLGRVYLAGVVLGGLSGAYLAFIAHGGIVARVGFAFLAAIWLYTAYRAYASIIRGDVAAHRAWMIRNYAATFGAVTLRLWLGLFMALGVQFDTAYRTVAWLSWAPNLLIAQMVFVPRLTDHD
jgi:uncharacterized membrane protein